MCVCVCVCDSRLARLRLSWLLLFGMKSTLVQIVKSIEIENRLVSCQGLGAEGNGEGQWV